MTNTKTNKTNATINKNNKTEKEMVTMKTTIWFVIY